MTAGFYATESGAGYVRVAYEDELMHFYSVISIDEAKALIRDLKSAVKDAEVMQ